MAAQKVSRQKNFCAQQKNNVDTSCNACGSYVVSLLPVEEGLTSTTMLMASAVCYLKSIPTPP